MNDSKILQIRNDTPGCLKKIHFNNAGSSLPCKAVVETMINYLNLEANIGGYEAHDLKINELNQFYNLTSNLISANNSQEIAFCESATYAWQRAITSLNLQSSDTIIIFESEYGSNYIMLLELAKRFQFNIFVIPHLESGDIDLNALEKKLQMDNTVKLISICHMPTYTGTLAPIETIGNIVSKYHAYYMVDATQTIGNYPVNVKNINADILFTTGRKFLRGPRGSGFLYMNEKLINSRSINPLIFDAYGAHWVDNHHYEFETGGRKFESFETNFAAKLGLSEAIKYVLSIGIDFIWERNKMLSEYVRSKISQNNKIKLADKGSQFGNIITFTHLEKSCSQVVNTLSQFDININTASTRYALIPLSKIGHHEVCRVSPHYFNTKEEIDFFLDKLFDL